MQQELNEKDQAKQKRKRIIDDVIGVIEIDSKFQKLQEYVEGKMIAGLRRNAGMHMFNNILATASDKEFFDALHGPSDNIRKLLDPLFWYGCLSDRPHTYHT